MMNEPEATVNGYSMSSSEEKSLPIWPPVFTPDNPPWNIPAAIAVWIASVLFIIFLPLLFVFPYAASLGISLQDSERLNALLQNDPNVILLNLAAIIPAHILTLTLAWLVVTRIGKFPFRQTLGWKWGGMKWWHFVVILTGFVIVAAIVGYFLPEQENDLLRMLRSSRYAVYILAFLATFTAPLVEEVVYRGVVYSAFRRAMGMQAAIVCITLLFAMVHVPQYYPSYGTILLITLLSFILALVRARTKNLYPCIILHTIFNGLQSLLLLFEPYLHQESTNDTARSVFNFFIR